MRLIQDFKYTTTPVRDFLGIAERFLGQPDLAGASRIVGSLSQVGGYIVAGDVGMKNKFRILRVQKKEFNMSVNVSVDANDLTNPENSLGYYYDYFPATRSDHRPLPKPKVPAPRNAKLLPVSDAELAEYYACGVSSRGAIPERDALTWAPAIPTPAPHRMPVARPPIHLPYADPRPAPRPKPRIEAFRLVNVFRVRAEETSRKLLAVFRTNLHPEIFARMGLVDVDIDRMEESARDAQVNVAVLDLYRKRIESELDALDALIKQ